MSAPTLVAPTKDPVDRREASGQTAFSIASLLGTGAENQRLFSAASNDVAVSNQAEFSDRSSLLENLIGAFSERCDNLMTDLHVSQYAPALFGPVWVMSAHEAGLRNEQWLMYWAYQRKGRVL